tara:strand:- start:1150 stop:2130 length:981 start_codon:yes stop_codon:yes gene_type:complete
MKICFASLRKKVNYTDVLEYGMDVFYESFRYYKDNNKQHEYSYYNFAWGSKGAERNSDVIKNADVIVFPAVQEFIYFANAMHPRDVEKSQSMIRETYEYLNNKDIILLTQDRGVDESMVMKYTFEKQVKPKSFKVIDEMDFTMCLQGLKYHFIKNYFRFETDKQTDFVYWGSDKSKVAGGEKSGDSRLNIIKSIRKNKEISSTIIGRWPFEVEKKWIPLKETLGYLDKSYSTLCFNWIDQTAVTGRYHEALACDVFPFVWKDYDTNNILVSDKFQRCFTIDEFYDKIKYIKDGNMLNKIKSDFIDRLPSEQEYYKEFEMVLNKCLK